MRTSGKDDRSMAEIYTDADREIANRTAAAGKTPQTDKEFFDEVILEWTEKLGSVVAFDASKGFVIEFSGLEMRRFLNGMREAIPADRLSFDWEKAMARSQVVSVTEIPNTTGIKGKMIRRTTFDPPLTVAAKPRKRRVQQRKKRMT